MLVLATLALGDVRDATCTNDAAHDTALLATTINASAAGDLVRIHGMCLVHETICLRGDCAYVGDSRSGTSIKQADGAHLAAVLASDTWCENRAWTGAPLRISSLTVDANRANNNGTVGIMIRSWQTVIEDTHVKGAASDGLRVTNLARDGATGLQTSQVNGRISNVFVEDSGGSGIRVLDTQNACTDWSLLDSWIASSGESAVLLDNAAGWQVRGLHTYDTQQHAIYANRCFATQLSDNYVEDMGHAGGANETYYGVACHAQSSAASLIANNKVHAFRPDLNATSIFVFVGVSGAAGSAESAPGVVSVHGNIVRGAGRAGEVGLRYEAGGGNLEVSSTANHVHGVGGTAREVGARVTLANTY